MMLHDGAYIATPDSPRRKIDGQRHSAVEREFHVRSGYRVMNLGQVSRLQP